GKDSWEKLAREGSLGNQAKKLLADRYVCVHIDTTTERGRQLASDFEVGDVGLVISDRSGRLQAFHHAGDLAGDDLSQYLERYADVGHTVQATDTHATSRTSFYPAPSIPASSYPALSHGWTVPSYGYPVGFSGFGGFAGGGACRG